MKFKGLKRTHYTDRWDEAFPIGNGTIGGLVYGNPLHETIATNHEELYLPLPENSDSRPFNGYKYLEHTRELIRDGKYKEATEYYIKGLEKEGAPENTIVWTNPYETASLIQLDIEKAQQKDVTDYVQKLDFATGEATVSFMLKDEEVSRRVFVSRSRDIMAVEIRKEGDPVNLVVSMTYNKDVKHMESIDIKAEGNIISCGATHSEDESGYVSAVRVISDGETEALGNSIRVEKTNYVLLFYTLAPWKARMEAGRVRIVRMLEDMTPDYESAFKEHEAIHRELFERVSLSFSEDETEYTNDQLRFLGTSDTVSPELLERMADYGRYLEIASFGKLPPNLQGIWNGNVTPPWSSDYTLDENIQMMMWQTLPGGFNGFTRCYLDWLESYTEDFMENAKAYYGCNGVFAAARVSTDGYHRHFSPQWPMVFWTAGAGWLSSVYEEYYEYNEDENILLRGVKFWKEVVKFYEDFLLTDRNGKFVFAPSYSPENTPLGNDSPTAVNATMDVAVCKEVYTNLIRATMILDIEQENREKWIEELKKLPDYTVNGDGAIKEWIPAEFKDDYHHRHSSHLYMVFPGHEALADGNEKLYEACHIAAKKRLIDGVDAISGWGLSHLANISARLNDPELWYMALTRLINVFTLDNLFTCHNEHNLFQMDANLGLTAAVYEMLVYCQEEEVRLFPIVTDRLPYIKVNGLRLKGNAELTELLKTDNGFRVTVRNNGKRDLRIICPDGFSFENGDTEYILRTKEEVSLTGIRR